MADSVIGDKVPDHLNKTGVRIKLSDVNPVFKDLLFKDPAEGKPTRTIEDNLDLSDTARRIMERGDDSWPGYKKKPIYPK